MKIYIAVWLFVVVVIPIPLAFGELKVGFYESSCPQAESIVKQVVEKRFNRDKSITAALLRMHFHDCFVRGCDASILIDSNESEKKAIQNGSVRGFDVIEEAKQAVEAACPSTVSCADMISIATRDAVGLAGGPKYVVPTGRRDGLVSKSSEVDLPGGGISVAEALEFFGKKGIKKQEMVSLMGGHSVGFAGGLALDKKTPLKVDNEFYKQIVGNTGVLSIDRNLAVDASTRGFVTAFAANNTKFHQSFANALIKMGSIQVLVGKAGEIRNHCSAFNQRI